MNNNVKKSSICLLDCTLRDGGYYKNWDFESDVVDRYLRAMQAASIDVIEIGFRSLPKSSFMGPYVYCTDEFIDGLDLPSDPTIGVMINCSELFLEKNSPKNLIRKLFRKADDSPIELVRIAVNFNRALEAESIACELKMLGYQVAINLMQVHDKKEGEYLELTEKISTWGTLDVLYFADSLGNMTPEMVAMVCRTLKRGWEGMLGIHTHNNKNLAFINTITAIENGVNWCDGTITGMGRGAGNAPTESLLMEMNLNGQHVGDATLLYESVEDFNRFKKIYNWGSNIYYHFASNNGIHPTFVQRLLSEKRYNSGEIKSALKYLSGIDARFYNQDLLETAVFPLDHDSQGGTWNATGWLAGQDVLIIGAGPSVKKHQKGIIKYIETNQPAVLILNMKKEIPVDMVTAYVACHPSRVFIEVGAYKSLDAPLIIPLTQFSKLLDEELGEVEVLDYGLRLVENGIKIEANGCGLKHPLAIGYALAVATQAGVKGINLIGFDGYDADDPRQEEMNEFFKVFTNYNKSVSIISLTPTSYNLNQGSIYSPVIK
tara:strand:- start:2788 stop:4425 length:1638 start_codon:yes stop_codon:yes gene_type:complete